MFYCDHTSYCYSMRSLYSFVLLNFSTSLDQTRLSQLGSVARNCSSVTWVGFVFRFDVYKFWESLLSSAVRAKNIEIISRAHFLRFGNESSGNMAYNNFCRLVSLKPFLSWLIEVKHQAEVSNSMVNGFYKIRMRTKRIINKSVNFGGPVRKVWRPETGPRAVDWRLLV